MTRAASLAALLLALLAPAARADAPPAPSPSSDESAEEQAAAKPAENAAPTVKVTAFALPHPGVAEGTMVAVMRAVESGLKKNPRLEMKDLDTRLADFAQEVPQDQIDAARAALKDGKQALLELRIPDAVAKLEEAVAGLSKVLPFIKKQELADAMAELAIAQFEGGDRKAGRAQFVELLTWRPDFVFDVQKLPPQYINAFEEAQREVERARRGSIRIASDPSGAQAYLDGKYIGVTPCVAEGQAVGKHFVTLKKEGYRKAVAPALAVGRKEARVNLALDRSEKYLLVEQARGKVEGSLGADLIDPDAENLKQVLFIEHAVFVKAAPERSDQVAVEAWLYDLRTRHRLSHVRKVAGTVDVEAQLESVAPNLYLNVNYEGELVAPADAPPPRPFARPPFYKTWWFWTAAAVVVAGAIGAGVAIAETRPASCPGGSMCINIIQ